MYFGKLHEKPFIGDERRKVEYEDIKRANHLLYATAFLCMFICVVAMMFICMLLSAPLSAKMRS